MQTSRNLFIGSRGVCRSGTRRRKENGFEQKAGVLCWLSDNSKHAMVLSFANQSNASVIDKNYDAWRRDPANVDAQWAAFFEGFELGNAAPLQDGAGRQMMHAPGSNACARPSRATCSIRKACRG